MADVEFEYNHPLQTAETSAGLISWLIKRGFARDARQAAFILLAAVLCLVILSVIVIFMSNGADVPSKALIDPEYGWAEPD